MNEEQVVLSPYGTFITTGRDGKISWIAMVPREVREAGEPVSDYRGFVTYYRQACQNPELSNPARSKTIESVRFDFDFTESVIIFDVAHQQITFINQGLRENLTPDEVEQRLDAFVALHGEKPLQDFQGYYFPNADRPSQNKKANGSGGSPKPGQAFDYRQRQMPLQYHSPKSTPKRISRGRGR